MAFKSRAELEARKKEIEGKQEFKQGADKDKLFVQKEQSVVELDLWSPASLKRFSAEELANRLVDIEEQYHDKLDQFQRQYLLIKWRLAAAIRDKYKSDKKFGEFLEDLRKKNPEHPLLTSTRLNREIQAGRFCEQHKITDLNKVRIYPTAIYKLSEPKNKDIAEEIFREIKGKNLPVTQVERIIAQKQAILTVDKQPQLPIMDYEQKSSEKEPTERKNVNVIDGVAQSESNHVEQSEAQQHKPIIPELIHSIKEKFFHHETKEETHDEELDEVLMVNPKTDNPHRKELLDILANADASMLNDDEVIDEMMLFMKQYRRSGIKLIQLFTAATDKAKHSVYPGR